MTSWMTVATEPENKPNFDQLADQMLAGNKQTLHYSRSRFLGTWLAVALLAMLTAASLILALRAADTNLDQTDDIAQVAHKQSTVAAEDTDMIVAYLRGEQGIPGVPGSDGQTGAPGQPGAPGSVVATEAAEAGEPGDKGDKGDPGTAGATGATGPVGASGPIGAMGTAGQPGANGSDGFDGVDGTQGERGSEGAQGPRGETGPAGPQGPVGPQGPAGPAGGAGSVTCPDGTAATQLTVTVTGGPPVPIVACVVLVRPAPPG